MKKLVLLTLITLSSAVNACVPGFDFVVTASAFLYTHGASVVLSEFGKAGTYAGSTIGATLGSATGIIFGSEAGAEAGRRIVEAAGQNVQHLPQDQRLGVAAGLIAAGYVTAKYGARIVIGV